MFVSYLYQTNYTPSDWDVTKIILQIILVRIILF